MEAFRRSAALEAEELAQARAELDLRGRVCPDATVETVRAVRALAPGAVLDVISDYYPARQTIPALVEQLGGTCELLDDSRPVFRLRIHKHR